MSERPILFNTEMVRAIREGRKVQTRRIIKPQPDNPRWNNIGWLGWDDGHGYRMKAPCEAGDILWVRETWYKDAGRYMYRANYADKEEFFFRNGREAQLRWYPSIHMPKEAARIFLRVRDVRVERLQCITPEGCTREGVEPGALNDAGAEFVRGMFHDLWDSTVMPRERHLYGWDADPWVWVIDFEKTDKPKGWLGGVV